jgi:hypothetical protein
MWKRHAIGIAACLALIGQQGAWAQSENLYSANYLMPGCRHAVAENYNSDHFGQGRCGGVVQTIMYFGRHFGVCVPDRTIAREAAKVIVLYVDQRPARMHERFEKLALEALQRAWPCR